MAREDTEAGAGRPAAAITAGASQGTGAPLTAPGRAACGTSSSPFPRGMARPCCAMIGKNPVVYKRDPRSAALWLVVIWMLPAAGPVLYPLFGINRVRRRAAALRR